MADPDEFIAELLAEARRNGGTDEELEKLQAIALEALIESAHEDGFLRTLRKHARLTLRGERKRFAGFERRNRRRWRKPLDELRTLIYGCEEIASEVFADFEEGRIEEGASFAALNHLFVKSALTMREVVCLVEGGFADAALARWRTLHELAVFARFIAGSDEHVAARFVASFDFRALSALKQIRRYADRARMEAPDDHEIELLQQKCAAHTRELGPRLGEEFGWAWPRLEVKRGLVDLEEATGLDHWRPRYRWASQNVHGGFRPPSSSLGVIESEEPLHLTGPSNSGMVDPIHMSALSFIVGTSAFLLRWPTAYRLMGTTALARIAEEVGYLAVNVEARSRAQALEKMKRHAPGWRQEQ